MTDKISDKALEKIKENHIKPRPKWEFLLKDYTIWTFFGISLVIGGLAFSVFLYMFINNDWDLYRYASDSFLGFILATLPYFWLVILVIFTVLAYFNFKKTKGGYLFGLSKIVLISLLVSFSLGAILYASGLGASIDNVFSQKVPFYDQAMKHRWSVWHKPREGVLIGRVAEIKNPKKFNLLDPKGEIWCIECPHVSSCPHINEVDRCPLKIVGEKGQECFQARIIRPFRSLPNFNNSKGECRNKLEKYNKCIK